MYKLILISVFIIPSLQSFAQCQVNVSNDTTLCEVNAKALLEADAENAIKYLWYPSQYLSSSTYKTTRATPQKTTTYTVEAYMRKNAEMVVNGDFENGNQNFISDYSFLANPNKDSGNFSEGKYIINNTAKNTHPCFADCGDYPTGKGKMLIVNGSSVPNTIVWSQTISVQPNTDYYFSAWVQNISCGTGFPAKLQFSINGKLLGSAFTTIDRLCVWDNFFEPWFSKDVSSATISIINQSTSLSGNDFAIDDISFGEYCTAKNSVTVTVNWQKIELQKQICVGDSFFINNKYQKQSGQFINKYKNKKGCDSFVTTNLIVNAIGSNPTITICSGDSAYLENKYRKVNGTYYDTFKSSIGCDSLVKAFLKVIPPQKKEILASLCFSDTFFYKNKVYTTEGVYYDTSYYYQCIDTITKIAITKIAEPHLYTLRTFCRGDSILWKNGYIKTDTIIIDSLKSQLGCDSLNELSFKQTGTPPNIADTAFFCKENLAIVDAGSYKNFLWNTGTKNRYLQTQNEGIYWVKVVDTSGCIMYDTLQIIERCRPIVFVPNAFTPNNDGINDYLFLSYQNLISLHFQLFDRWGKLLFETTNPNFSWDGKYNDVALPFGIYQWIATFEGLGNNNIIVKQQCKGFINILE
jgi:gliding motility-associated-like protein